MCLGIVRLYTSFVSLKLQFTLNEMVDKKIISSKMNRGIPELVGTFGVFASAKIPKNTVIGRNLGFELTNREWNEIFDFTKCDLKNTPYLFSFAVDEKARDSHDDSRTITIDSIAGGMHNLKLLYINDCRNNINEPELSAEDMVWQNCMFVVVRVQGWPSAFVVTTKTILKGGELLLDYGAPYWKLIQQNNRWTKLMKERNRRTIANVVGNVKLDDCFQLS